MERRFDSIVLIPLSLVVGMASGIMVMTGNIPVELVNRAVTVLLAAFVALVVVELLIRTVSDAVLGALFFTPEEEPGDGAPGELTVLLIRDGEVVGEVKSWDKPLGRGKRDYWAKKLGRLFARRSPAPGPTS